MKGKELEWIESCKAKLIESSTNKEQAAFILDAFIAKFQLEFQKEFDSSYSSSASLKIRHQLSLIYKRLLYFFKPLKLTFPKNWANSNLAPIIFWPVLPMHIGFLQPIYSEASSQDQKAVFITNSARTALKLPATISQIKIKNLEGLSDRKELRVEKNQLLEASKELIPINYKGKKIYFENLLKRAFLNFPFFLQTIDIFEKLILQNKPSCIFVGYDVTLTGRTVCLLAKKKGIQTATTQHGSNNNSILKYSIANNNFVFGDRYRKHLSQVIIDKAVKITPVGSTKFESYFNKEKSETPKEILDLVKEKSYFFIAFSGPGHAISELNHRQSISILKSLAESFKDELFVIKLHPKDHKYYYTELELLSNVILIDDQHPNFNIAFPAWLPLAKAMITGGSAGALEALIFKKPVITIDSTQEISDFDMIRSRVTFHANSTEELGEQAHHILNKTEFYFDKMKSAQLYIKDCFSNESAQQTASQQILNIILQETQQKCVA